MTLLTITDDEAQVLAEQATMEADRNPKLQEYDPWQLADFADELDGLSAMCRLIADRSGQVTTPLRGMLRRVNAKIAEQLEFEREEGVDPEALAFAERDYAVWHAVLDRTETPEAS